LLRLSAALTALALALPVAEQEAYAQAPKTIRFIVPFPAGGGADLLVRVLSDQIGRSAGAATVVENRPGAASIVGTEFVSRATPDGGTVLIAANSFIIHPFFKKLNYDPLTSFAPIAWLATSPQVVVVNAAGNGPAINELLGRHVDLVMANYAEAAEYIKGGHLRALAVGSPARLEWLPEVPTIARL